MPQTLGSGAGNIAASVIALSIVDYTNGAASAITTAGTNFAPAWSKPVPLAGNYRLRFLFGITGGLANAPTTLSARTVPGNAFQKISGGAASTIIAPNTTLALWNKGSAFLADDVSPVMEYAVDLALAAGDHVGRTSGSSLQLLLDGVSATATVRWICWLARIT